MRLIKVVKAHCAPLSARALTTAVKAQMSQIFCIFVLCSELLSSIRVHLLVEFLITKKPAGSNLVFWIVSRINWLKKIVSCQPSCYALQFYPGIFSQSIYVLKNAKCLWICLHQTFEALKFLNDLWLG